MADTRTLLRKIVAEAYDVLAESGASFSIEQVVAAARPEAVDLGDVLLDEAVWSTARRIDKDRTTRQENATLWGDLDRVVVVGENRRRRKGSCTLRDLNLNLAMKRENARRVTAALAIDESEYEALAPLMEDPKVTVDQAVTLLIGDEL